MKFRKLDKEPETITVPVWWPAEGEYALAAIGYIDEWKRERRKNIWFGNIEKGKLYVTIEERDGGSFCCIDEAG